MDNNMLKIDVSSKAVETFIDAISRGIGVLYEPTRIRKEAKAKAEEKVILAKAEKQEREILAAVQPLVGDSVSLEQLQPVISKMISDELRKKENGFIYQDLAIIIEQDKGAAEVGVSIYELTIAGAEIYKILDIEKDMSLLDKAAAMIKKPNVRFGYSKLIDIRGDSIIHEDTITYL